MISSFHLGHLDRKSGHSFISERGSLWFQYHVGASTVLDLSDCAAATGLGLSQLWREGSTGGVALSQLCSPPLHGSTIIFSYSGV